MQCSDQTNCWAPEHLQKARSQTAAPAKCQGVVQDGMAWFKMADCNRDELLHTAVLGSGGGLSIAYLDR